MRGCLISLAAYTVLCAVSPFHLALLVLGFYRAPVRLYAFTRWFLAKKRR